jgi:hypothetical protein
MREASLVHFGILPQIASLRVGIREHTTPPLRPSGGHVAELLTKHERYHTVVRTTCSANSRTGPEPHGKLMYVALKRRGFRTLNIDMSRPMLIPY